MNTMVPEPVIPSHQGPDAKTVLPDLDVVTIAAKGAHTQTHNHYWTLQLTRRASRDEVLDALRAAPRIAFIRMSDGLVALNSTVELMRDLGRPRGDMWEVAVWEDLVTVDGDEAYLTYQVGDGRRNRGRGRCTPIGHHHRPLGSASLSSQCPECDSARSCGTATALQDRSGNCKTQPEPTTTRSPPAPCR